MDNYYNAVNKLYSEKEKLLIIGLTGRTGAGCSTAANILKKNFDELDFEYIDELEHKKEDKYKFNIIKEYIKNDERWVPFTIIEGSCVILSFIFEKSYSSERPSDSLVEYFSTLQGINDNVNFKIDNYANLISEINGLDYIFEEIQQLPLSKLESELAKFSDDDIKNYYSLYIKKMPDYKERIKKILLKYSCYEEKKQKIQDEPPVKFHLYTYFLQKVANNIRASGDPYSNIFDQDQIFSFAKRLEVLINLIIKYDQITEKQKTRVCIDAIRNANESNYLKDIYRPYYLISISVDEITRRNRLDKLNIDEKISLDNVEYNSKLKSGELFYHQNIATCFEMADIHLVNQEEFNNKIFFLTYQLVKYITLMIHPGLITPSDIERCMQLAYNAKYNSGCLSRQVGAVVTRDDFSIKSIGWNEVPKGQLSCGLRSIDSYCKGNEKECFSEFEYEDKTFQKVLKGIQKTLQETNLHGRMFPYCFKDVYNGYTGEKNQVYTRALHAEENAFLQISRYGGQGVKNGYLFCTASPCELCAKKAYQLGITNIYYIDPYPGISQKHILTFGKNESNPQMQLFYGAIGEAFIRLYKPLLSYKDELELASGVNCKIEANKCKNNIPNKPKTKDFLYHSVECTMKFKNRENIECVRIVDMEITGGTHEFLDRQMTWTGSSYDQSELLDNPEGYTLIDSKDKTSPYKYQIRFNKKLKSSDKVKYTICSKVKDETHLMHEYLAQMIKFPTKHLILKVVIPKSSPFIENVRFKRYADLLMECEYDDDKNNVNESVSEDGKEIIYTLNIENPNLFYTYSVEWDFIKLKS